MLKLTMVDGKPIWLVMPQACALWPCERDGAPYTNICFRSGLFWEVKETPQEIAALCEERHLV